MNLRRLTSFIKFNIDWVIPKLCGIDFARTFQLSTFIRYWWFSWNMLSQTKGLPEKYSWVRTSDFPVLWRLVIGYIFDSTFKFNYYSALFLQTVTCLKVIRLHLMAGKGQCPANDVFKNIITNRHRSRIYLQ